MAKKSAKAGTARGKTAKSSTTKGAKTKTSARKTSATRGGTKKSARSRKSFPKTTLHDVFDRIVDLEKSVRAGAHPDKAPILKFAETQRNAWEAFCRSLHDSGECNCANFCRGC